ncbi:M24 family metallopeptidase [bacterium]|nr:M24 family metallopeptidase [bacterium]
MRQTFDVIGGPDLGRSNLPRLRAILREDGLDGVFIPHEDEYQNEYLPARNERLAWATGFTGSAGSAFVFAARAVLFVDGRYTLQARSQVAGDLFEIVDMPDPGPDGWLATQVFTDLKIGYDPHLMSPDALARLESAAAKSGAKLVPTARNPVDAAWTDRPGEPTPPVVPHLIEHAGEASSSKRTRLGKSLSEDGVDATVITSPASIAWLFNVRGGDVSRTPLPLGRAILHADGQAELFLRPEKVTPELGSHLGNEVQIRPIRELEHRLHKLAGKRVALDPSAASAWFFETLNGLGAEVKRAQDPCVLPRARKNAIEIEGARRAHRRDGAALARFLHWIDEKAGDGSVTEIEATLMLESFREETGELKDLSFDSISGAGPNGAIVHYRASQATSRRLEPGSLFLIDSGGQYLDGTTDVTRTIAIGEPTAEMRERYTRVLKGHIALARIRFPKGVTGSQLDALARQPLWEAGLDYDHGTGHGVGSYLGVHEGPHGISKKVNTVALEPGMVVSNEPGYYKTGAYGIRIENLQVVTEAKPIAGGERPMMGFETLTLAPLDRRLIETGLLSEQEWTWVNRYHGRVLAEIGPLVPGDPERGWLAQMCAEL